MIAPDPVQYAGGWPAAPRASSRWRCVTLSVGLGLAMAGRLARRPGAGAHADARSTSTPRSARWSRSPSTASPCSVDPWLHPGPAGIAVPFDAWPTARSSPAWASSPPTWPALLGLSFYARRRIGARLWRRAHRLTIVV